jgi:hypothetical protein
VASERALLGQSLNCYNGYDTGHYLSFLYVYDGELAHAQAASITCMKMLWRTRVRQISFRHVPTARSFREILQGCSGWARLVQFGLISTGPMFLPALRHTKLGITWHNQAGGVEEMRAKSCVIIKSWLRAMCSMMCSSSGTKPKEA